MHNPSLLHYRRRAPRAMKHIPQEETDLEETIEMLAVDLTLENGANEDNAIELDLWGGEETEGRCERQRADVRDGFVSVGE